MTLNVYQALLIIALVFFLLAGFNIPSSPRVSWGWLGAAALTVALFFT